MNATSEIVSKEEEKEQKEKSARRWEEALVLFRHTMNMDEVKQDDDPLFILRKAKAVKTLQEMLPMLSTLMMPPWYDYVSGSTNFNLMFVKYISCITDPDEKQFIADMLALTHFCQRLAAMRSFSRHFKTMECIFAAELAVAEALLQDLKLELPRIATADVCVTLPKQPTGCSFKVTLLLDNDLVDQIGVCVVTPHPMHLPRIETALYHKDVQGITYHPSLNHPTNLPAYYKSARDVAKMIRNLVLAVHPDYEPDCDCSHHCTCTHCNCRCDGKCCRCVMECECGVYSCSCDMECGCHELQRPFRKKRVDASASSSHTSSLRAESPL